MCSNKVLCVYGEGGHHAQMDRLVDGVSREALNKVDFLSLSDVKNKPKWSLKHFHAKEIRSKHLRGIAAVYFMIKNITSNFFLLVSIFKNYKIKAVISTGPGIGVFTCLFFKAVGSKVIYLETWSRFDKKSMSGRVMRLIADEFYYQNLELATIYPKGKFSGRL